MLPTLVCPACGVLLAVKPREKGVTKKLRNAEGLPVEQTDIQCPVCAGVVQRWENEKQLIPQTAQGAREGIVAAEAKKKAEAAPKPPAASKPKSGRS
jgi:hypothetical protein